MFQNCVLFDDPAFRSALLPLVFTRPVAELRVGILTLREKWEHHLGVQVSWQTEGYLAKKFSLKLTDYTLFINPLVLPTLALVEAVRTLGVGEALFQENILLAARGSILGEQKVQHQFEGTLAIVRKLTDILKYNESEIFADYQLLTHNRTSQKITDKHTATYNESQIFLEEGVQLRAAVLNAENGPIYLGKNVQVQEGCLIQGPFSAGEGTVLNLGAKFRRNTSIGPYCKVGGEVSSSIIMGYSNKGHDGFLGNSVLGEWCNLGANTNNSNLKNDYGNVKLYSYATAQLEDTQRQFIGLFMGDYSKTGISTMFNTGTVVGVSSNIFGAGFPPKHIPSFQWGGAAGLEPYRFEKALEVAQNTRQRRGQTVSDTDEAILRAVAELDR